MLSRSRLSAVVLGLFLAVGPAIADDRPPIVHTDTGTLTAESDFTVFMGKDVPEEVRRAALRRPWVLMQLPVSCHELCLEPEPAAPGVALATGEKLAVATSERGR